MALRSPITSMASPVGTDSDEGPLEEATDGDEWPRAADNNITFHFVASATEIASVASNASITPSMKQMAPCPPRRCVTEESLASVAKYLSVAVSIRSDGIVKPDRSRFSVRLLPGARS